MDKDKFNSYRKKVGTGQMIGSRGEMFVGFLLSSFCLVRPVANGTDVGVDLYCEALIDGVPHSHFWVQIKTQMTKLPKRKTFEVRDLEYWSRQPIPVFIFLVSGEKMDFNNFQINIINLSEKFIAEPYIDPINTLKKSLSTDLTISSHNELKSFIFDEVPKTIARLYVRDGVIFHTRRTVHEEYIKTYDFKDIHKYARPIMKNIGRMSALLIRDIINQRLKDDDLNRQRKQLERILETYWDWGNSDFHFTLGLSKITDKDFAGAIPCFQRALANVDSDKRLKLENATYSRKILVNYIEFCQSRIDG